MDISSLLLAEFPQATFGSPQSAKAASEHPRDVVAANIGHCIAHLNNPGYTHDVRGKPQAPTPCYSVANGVAKVTLKYCHEKLKLNAQGDTEIVVPVAQLGSLLARLKVVVEQQHFDAQLDEIKATRVALQKSGMSKNKVH